MDLISKISADIDWRMSELASLKSIPLRYHILPHHQEMLIKYTVPSIYSLWEGFVRNSFKNYVEEINLMELSIKDVHINLLVHSITSIDKLRLENPRTSFQSKKSFTEHYLSTVSKPLKIKDAIPTKSNVNYEVINEILQLFNLDFLPKIFAKPLEKLVTFRNSIAHGEVSIPIKMKDLEFFTTLLNDLMVEILLRIEHGLNFSTFKSI